jgi:hypothetical protein
MGQSTHIPISTHLEFPAYKRPPAGRSARWSAISPCSGMQDEEPAFIARSKIGNVCPWQVVRQSFPRDTHTTIRKDNLQLGHNGLDHARTRAASRSTERASNFLRSVPASALSPCSGAARCPDTTVLASVCRAYHSLRSVRQTTARTRPSDTQKLTTDQPPLLLTRSARCGGLTSRR